MNAKQHQHPMQDEHVSDLSQNRARNPEVSALVDGELNSSELEALLTTLDADGLENWHAYQVIGDVLRGHQDPSGPRAASDFLAAVRLGLVSVDGSPDTVPPLPTSVAMPMLKKVRPAAANDAVFRWKLVAGFASLAAVMAVSWGVVSSSGTSGAGGAQLAATSPALAAPAATVGTGVVPASNASVAVNTGQGVLIRDAQLEALLAEHRQYGGMSALQMPSGFIRNATYEAAGR